MERKKSTSSVGWEQSVGEEERCIDSNPQTVCCVWVGTVSVAPYLCLSADHCTGPVCVVQSRQRFQDVIGNKANLLKAIQTFPPSLWWLQHLQSRYIYIYKKQICIEVNVHMCICQRWALSLIIYLECFSLHDRKFATVSSHKIITAAVESLTLW